MAVHTTLHLDAKIAEMLDEQAAKHGISRSQMILMLIQKLMQQCEKLSTSSHSIRYQKKNSTTQWRRVHIKLDLKNYFFLIEMRCFYKFSASALISMALNDIIKNQNKINRIKVYDYLRDNYFDHGSKLLYNKENMSINWHIIWKKIAKQC